MLNVECSSAPGTVISVAPPRRPAAFTLIELLVVMGIIGILAGLVLTAVSKAKNQGAKITDVNNLKQIIICLHLYTTDNSERIPWPNWLNGDGPARQGWLYALDTAAIGPAEFKAETGLYWPTLRDKRLYACPMDHPEQHPERDQQLSSYVMNGAVIGFDRTNYPPLKATQFHPDDVMYWETDETQPSYFNDGASLPSEGVSKRHNQGAVCAALGGVVRYIRFSDWYAMVNNADRNNLWCYPDSPNGR